MRLAALQYDIAWQQKAENWAAMERMLHATALPEGSLALLPELADTGFTMDRAAALAGDSIGAAVALAQRMRIGLVVGHATPAHGAHGAHAGTPAGTAFNAPARPANAATVIDARGAVLGTYRKVHLFSPGREHMAYAPGHAITVVPFASGGDTWQVCPLICYDLRFPELFRVAALAGAEVFLVGASWPAVRAAHWRALAIARAIENQAYVVACNRVGHDPHAEYAGGSIIVAPDGTVLAEAGADACVLHADAEREVLTRWRERFPALRDVHRSLIGEAPFETPPIC